MADKRVDFTYTADNQFDTIKRYSDLTATTLVATSTYGYDADLRIDSLTHVKGGTTYADYAWAYDADGWVTTATNSSSTSEDAAYTYDFDGQLTAATYANDSALDQSYSYDANGNPTNAGDSLNANSNQLASDGTFDYYYDADGALIRQVNISTSAQTLYTYNNPGALTSVTDKDSGGTITQVIDYTYDVFGELIARSVTPYTSGMPGTTTTENFVRDGATGNIVLQFDGSGNLTDRYLWGPGVNNILADEQVVSLGSAGTVYWSLPDNQGSVANVIDSSGTLKNHTAFDPFGNKISSLSSAAVGFIFAQYGEYADPATGQVFAQDRVYNPWLDRWDRTDPLGLLPGSNDYEDVGNAPTNFTDPSGLEAPGGFPGYHGAGPNSVARNRAEAADFLADYFHFLFNPSQMDKGLRIANGIAYGMIGISVGTLIGAGAGLLAGAGTIFTTEASEAVASIVGSLVGSTVGGTVGGAVGGCGGGTLGRTIGGIGGAIGGGIGGSGALIPPINTFPRVFKPNPLGPEVLPPLPPPPGFPRIFP